MDAHSSTLLLDLRKVNAVVSARLGLVVVGEGVEARRFRSFFRQNVVRHADNRRRVQATAQFGEDRRIRTQSALNGLPEDVAEVLFIFRIRLVANARRRAKAPEAFDIRHDHLECGRIALEALRGFRDTASDGHQGLCAKYPAM